MTDDAKPQIKLSQQLVMTPQLQMAIRMLGTPSADLVALIAPMTGLVAAADPLRRSTTTTGSSASLATPPTFGSPVARANRAALPSVQLAPDLDADQLRDAQRTIRALRPRAKTSRLAKGKRGIGLAD